MFWVYAFISSHMDLVLEFLCDCYDWFTKKINFPNIFLREKTSTLPSCCTLWQITFKDTPLSVNKLTQTHTFCQNGIPVLDVLICSALCQCKWLSIKREDRDCCCLVYFKSAVQTLLMPTIYCLNLCFVLWNISRVCIRGVVPVPTLSLLLSFLITRDRIRLADFHELARHMAGCGIT